MIKLSKITFPTYVYRFYKNKPGEIYRIYKGNVNNGIQYNIKIFTSYWSDSARFKKNEGTIKYNTFSHFNHINKISMRYKQNLIRGILENEVS